MDKKQMESIARHYLGERLIRVEYTPSNKPPFCVVYNSGSECHDGLYGNNVEEMCSRIAAELKSRGWVPTHERLEWHLNRRLALLRLRAGNVSSPLWWIQIDDKGCYAASSDDVEPKSRMFANMLLTDVVTEIAEWCNKNLPYYLPPFPENKQ